jgi:hypothetical protein
MQKFEFEFNKFLSQKIEKEMKFLFISHLVYVEDLLKRGLIDEQEYSIKRKEILDRGNAAVRNCEEQISSIFSNMEMV